MLLGPSMTMVVAFGLPLHEVTTPVPTPPTIAAIEEMIIAILDFLERHHF
jgi:hypothetical protein